MHYFFNMPFLFHSVFVSNLLTKAVTISSTPIINGSTMTITRYSDWNNKVGELIEQNNIDTVIIRPETQMFNTITEIDGLKVSTFIIDNLFVTTFDENVFKENKFIKTVQLTDSVTEISDSCFEDSTLETINLDRVNKYGGSVFKGCLNLKSLSINADTIPSSFARGCYQLTSVKFNKEKTTILNTAFASCISLTEIDLTNVVSVGDGAFKDTEITKIHIPQQLQSIGANGFYRSKITEITIDDRNNLYLDIGSGAFAYTMLKEVKIPEYVTLASGAFQNNPYLTKVEVLGDLNALPDYCFCHCHLLKTVTTKKVTTIGVQAFYNDKELADFTVADLQAIGDQAFEFCGNLKMTIPATTLTIGNFAFGYTKSVKIAEGSLLKSVGQYAFVGSQIDEVVVSFAVDIGSFQGCHKLTKVTITSPCNKIASYCFCNCTNINTLIIQGGLESIDSFAFSSCFGLRNIDISNVSVLNSDSFSFVEIEKVKMSNCVIAKNAFYGSSSITQITLTKETKSFDATPFSQFKIKNVILEDGNKYLTVKDGSFVYYNSSTLAFALPDAKSFTVPDYCKGIQHGAFSIARKLTKIVFANKIDLTQVNLQDSAYIYQVTFSINDDNLTIPKEFFANCQNLEKVIFETKIKTIPENCFANCINLYQVVLPTTCETIETRAFYNCQSLSKVDISKVTSIYPETFMNSGISNLMFDNCHFLNTSLFKNCFNLKTFDFTGIIYVSNNCFENSSLKTITLDERSFIEDEAFKDCHLLTKADLSLITSIPKGCFLNCIKLSEVVMRHSVLTIGEEAFANTSLVEVVIPDRVSFIGKRAFRDTLSLKTLTLGKGITTLTWEDALFVRSNVEKIIIDKDCKIIERDAFELNPNLKIEFKDNRFFSFIDNFIVNTLTSTLLTSVGKLEPFIKIPTTIDFVGLAGIKHEEFIDEFHQIYTRYTDISQTFVTRPDRAQIIEVPETVKQIQDKPTGYINYKRLFYNGTYMQEMSVPQADERIATLRYNFPQLYTTNYIIGDSCSDNLDYDEFKWRHVLGMSSLEKGMIAAVSIAGVALIVSLILLLLIVFKMKRHGNYEAVSMQTILTSQPEKV